MKILKFLERIGYLPMLAFGSACLVTGLISVVKVLINAKDINSWDKLMHINSNTFDAFIKPFSVAFFVIFVGVIVVLRLMGKGHLIKKHTPL